MKRKSQFWLKGLIKYALRIHTWWIHKIKMHQIINTKFLQL